MDIDKLERAIKLAKGLIPRTDELLNMSSSKKSNRIRLGDSLYELSEYDNEFRTKFMQLIRETRNKLQKEFDEI